MTSEAFHLSASPRKRSKAEEVIDEIVRQTNPQGRIDVIVAELRLEDIGDLSEKESGEVMNSEERDESEADCRTI